MTRMVRLYNRVYNNCWALALGISSCLAMLPRSQRLIRRQPFSLTARTQIFPEADWRAAAINHQHQIYKLLQPGLTDPSHVLNSGSQRQKQHQCIVSDHGVTWSALDPFHPVYNFLIEYYGLKGIGGVKRLARWSPHPHPTGVLLEGATKTDTINGLLHSRGAELRKEGIVYHSRPFFESLCKCTTADATNNNNNNNSSESELARVAKPFLWFRSVLQATLDHEPVLHCYNLHEWAMLYQPSPDDPPPPSAKYQAHLPLRVHRDILNATVERKGVCCTHVDAIRYFAPTALPISRHAEYNRQQQLQWEQPACVHSSMDLLKFAIRVQPYIDATMLRRTLKLALEARLIDVAASPYDASAYNVTAIPVETVNGRDEYKRQQKILLQQAQPIRRDLLQFYNEFLEMTFPEYV